MGTIAVCRSSAVRIADFLIQQSRGYVANPWTQTVSSLGATTAVPSWESGTGFESGTSWESGTGFENGTRLESGSTATPKSSLIRKDAVPIMVERQERRTDSPITWENKERQPNLTPAMLAFANGLTERLNMKPIFCEEWEVKRRVERDRLWWDTPRWLKQCIQDGLPMDRAVVGSCGREYNDDDLPRWPALVAALAYHQQNVAQMLVDMHVRGIIVIDFTAKADMTDYYFGTTVLEYLIQGRHDDLLRQLIPVLSADAWAVRNNEGPIEAVFLYGSMDIQERFWMRAMEIPLTQSWSEESQLSHYRSQKWENAYCEHYQKCILMNLARHGLYNDLSLSILSFCAVRGRPLCKYELRRRFISLQCEWNQFQEICSLNDFR